MKHFLDLPSGDPENPIYEKAGRFEQEIVEKFKALLNYQPDYKARTDKMIAAISTLEKQTDVSKFMALFTPKGQA